MGANNRARKGGTQRISKYIYIYTYITYIYIYIYYANDMAMAATQRVLILGSWSGFCSIVSLKESGLE